MMITLKILVFCIALWLIALISLPFILNSSQGQKFALEQLRKVIPGILEIKSFHVSWLGPQRFENIAYHNPQKSAALYCKEIEIDNSLLSFVVPGIWTFHTKIADAQVQMAADEISPRGLTLNDLRGSLNLKADIYSRKLYGAALDLKGADGSLTLFGSDNNGILTLQKPLEANIVTTSDVGQRILQECLPFIKAVVNTEEPLKVVIAQEGFALPLNNFQWSRLQFKQAKIDLGKMTIQNSGPLAKVIKVIAPDKPEKIKLWLTPAYLSMANGMIYLDRIDILALDKFPLAAWGKINLADDKLKMTLGITPKALKGVVDIPAPLDKEMLLLPLTGSLKDAEIDTSKLKTSIGQMAIQLLGKLMKSDKNETKDNAKDTENEKIPPPTTQPLPWE